MCIISNYFNALSIKLYCFITKKAEIVEIAPVVLQSVLITTCAWWLLQILGWLQEHRIFDILKEKNKNKKQHRIFTECQISYLIKQVFD